MIRQLLLLLLIGYLPGALVFRLPVANRSARAKMPIEERLFWNVFLSLAWSSIVTLGLAAAGFYRFEYLLWANGGLSLLLLGVGRSRLRLGREAARPTWTALLPLGIAVFSASVIVSVPPSEYVMGGKDPGTYFNEGIQIAQRGSLVTTDAIVASIPAPFRPLFLRDRGDAYYHSNRFMGFFVLDPGAGTVVGQFPHLYPAWIAIAYGVNGLSGARWVSAFWAVLGVLAVYFAGARILGRTAAAAGAALLGMHVLQIWYARYPNAELVFQALVFAALLAYVRAHADDDGFFAPVAAILFVLGFAAHVTGALAIAAIVGVSVLGRLEGQRMRPWFLVPLAAGSAIAVAYLATTLPPYFAVPLGFVRNLPAGPMAFSGVLAVAAVLLWRVASRPAPAAVLQVWLPRALTAVVMVLAGYALMWRSAGGLLAQHDADSLRTFVGFYLFPVGFAAALVGFALVSLRFGTTAPLLVVFAAFAFAFFYKIRIVPEHFWAGRRLLAVILPGSILLAAAAASSEVAATGRLAWIDRQPMRTVRIAVGTLLIVVMGWQFARATQPIRRHVEYAGLIPRLEKLASTFQNDDLVLVEARNASDVHVLALPLAYIYARNVLVLADVDPDKRAFRDFMLWARTRYKRIFFMGGGGTELLSRTMKIDALAGDRFQIPEYESALNAYPRAVRAKEFDFGIYEFLPGTREAAGFDLDVGLADDLYVRRFHSKERQPSGLTYRWTRDVSYISVLGASADHRRVTLWMGAGGRPAAAPPATIDVYLNDQPIGSASIGVEISPREFSVPGALALALSQSEDAAQLRVVSTTWNPKQLLASRDDRDLGVMIDRIRID
jgi:hypothetical protein